MKANQIEVAPNKTWDELEMWMNKIIYLLRGYENETKEIQLKRVEEALLGVGTPKQIQDKVKHLVCQKLRL